ncbi:hypothetical protein ARMSODRAFT_978507 [Armillaria solidipes]|uniref:NAD(P)-binding protein n=1 Tax=Armillaria solidipes TaxID=1076256 RepID=A0A2H3B2H8_9AGAR|nr:hypothetical protein ARMSODRAFT_978507 [Armillaria solidipes]
MISAALRQAMVLQPEPSYRLSETLNLCPRAPSLPGKLVMVVGPGIRSGLETSKHFARTNPERLVLACRNEEKGREAVLRLSLGMSTVPVYGYGRKHYGDFTGTGDPYPYRIDAIAKARRYGTAYEIDGAKKRTTFGSKESGLCSQEGAERQATYSSLRRQSRSCNLDHVRWTSLIVVVTSDVHYWTTSEKELFESPNILVKLSTLNVPFVRAFQQCLPPSTITINFVHPGFCISNLRSTLSEGYQEADAKQKAELAFMTVDSEGSRQLMFSAVRGTNGEDKLRGACISLSKVVEECDFVISEDVQDKVWYLKNWIHGVPLRLKGESNK